MLRTLICSNADFVVSGYGIQTRFLIKAFRDLGHEVYVLPNWGLQGGPVKLNGVQYLPPFRDEWGTDIVGQHVKTYGIDAVLNLHDVWTLRPEWPRSAGVPWITYSPVDSEPVAPRLVTMLKEARHIVAMSRFGQREMSKVGLPSTYIPHAFNCDIYCPGDKEEARRELGVSRNKFIVLIAGANQGYPSRKAFPEQMAAFAAFHQEFPDSELLLHTAMTPTNKHGGLDLYDLIRSLGLFSCTANTPEYDIAMGLSDERMALMYRAADVILNASYSEGFGMMPCEAQACGTPAIVHDFAASPEFLFAGEKVPSVQRFWTLLGSWYAIPSIPGITAALRKIYLNRDEYAEAGLQAAEQIRQELSFDVVRDTYWKPFLEEVEEGLGRGWLKEVSRKAVGVS